MFRIIIGIILIVFFLFGLFSEISNEKGEVFSAIMGGTIFLILPGILFIYYGIRSRYKTHQVSNHPVSIIFGSVLIFIFLGGFLQFIYEKKTDIVSWIGGGGVVFLIPGIILFFYGFKKRNTNLKKESIISENQFTSGMVEYMNTYCCSKCNKELEKIGIPPEIQMLQMYKQVVNIGSTEVPEEIKNNPYLYKGFFCPSCNKAFCPQCSNMQGAICPECGQRGLMPAYRPLLKKIAPTPAKPAILHLWIPPGAKVSLFITKTGKQGMTYKCEGAINITLQACPHCKVPFNSRPEGKIVWLYESRAFPENQGFFCLACNQELIINNWLN
jgi:hypothetical protein